MFAKSLLAVSLVSSTLGAPQFMVPCSGFSGTPCRCPVGTDYVESVSTVIIGATAVDVERLTNDFFDPVWAGINPHFVQGPDNFPGISIRDVNVTTLVGTYGFSERLISRFVFPDGSYEQKWEQRGIVPYHSGNGSFSGLWATLKGSRIFENQTLLRFSNYACETGHTMNFAAFHEIALTNATNLLGAGGKLHGVSTKPVSAQNF